MQFRVRRRGGGDRYRCCLAFILTFVPSFLRAFWIVGRNSGYSFHFFHWVGGWKSKLRTTRVLFYIGFIFSREFQLSEMREVDHGGKMGHPRWDVGGNKVPGVMGIDTGQVCWSRGRRSWGVGVVGFSRLPLFLVVAVWSSLWFE